MLWTNATSPGSRSKVKRNCGCSSNLSGRRTYLSVNAYRYREIYMCTHIHTVVESTSWGVRHGLWPGHAGYMRTLDAIAINSSKASQMILFNHFQNTTSTMENHRIRKTMSNVPRQNVISIWISVVIRWSGMRNSFASIRLEHPRWASHNLVAEPRSFFQGKCQQKTIRGNDIDFPKMCQGKILLPFEFQL